MTADLSDMRIDRFVECTPLRESVRCGCRVAAAPAPDGSGRDRGNLRWRRREKSEPIVRFPECVVRPHSRPSRHRSDASCAAASARPRSPARVVRDPDAIRATRSLRRTSIAPCANRPRGSRRRPTVQDARAQDRRGIRRRFVEQRASRVRAGSRWPARKSIFARRNRNSGNCCCSFDAFEISASAVCGSSASTAARRVARAARPAWCRPSARSVRVRARRAVCPMLPWPPH